MRERQMKPEKNSNVLLSVTKSKAKMYEYDVSPEYHIDVSSDPSRLFMLTIGILGEAASIINSNRITLEEDKLANKYLQFSSQFFDSYMQSKLNSSIDFYLNLIGSASYYLCDLPGSSTVLAKNLPNDCPDLGCFGLENLLLWLLKGDFSVDISLNIHNKYNQYITKLLAQIAGFYSHGVGESEIYKNLKFIREIAYYQGSARELFFGDILGAVVKKKIYNSSWECLPKYTDLNMSDWIDVIKKENFISELWPSQRMLGENGIFRGKSAIVQMPTSAGKTKSIEIIIRSSF
jgi:POLQ-like helicase